MRRKSTIAPDYFEGLYRDKGDPWEFETSPYEAAKYARTLAAIPRPHVSSILEVGCANGVLTVQLAARCDDLLGVDVSPTALAAARQRCAGQPHVRFAQSQLPCDRPEGCFDLIVLSEVVYYLDRPDVERLAAYLAGATRSGGHLLLVHWIGQTDYPLSADDAVAALRVALGPVVGQVLAERHERYRLDLWQRM